MSIRILEPIDGAILNRHDGRAGDGGLEIDVKGECPAGAQVCVNGRQAQVRGTEFRCALLLNRHEHSVTAETVDERATVRVLYDRNSFRRYRFSLDDNILFLRDIARHNYRSIFDNPYMAVWRDLHLRYGTRINCNIYFQGADFDLTMMPARYRGEWRDNADWFRLTFHALQNDPRDPYISAGYGRIAADYDRVANEILRFAGEEAMNTFTTIHWGEATVEGCRALRDRGIRGLCGYFIFGPDGKPRVSYYLDRARTEHLAQRDYWKDMDEDLIFIRHDIVINLVHLADVVPHLEDVVSVPQRRDVMELMIHEQHFYPDFVAYIPEYAERCETAVRWVTENGYQPVWYSDGFVGAPP